MIKLSRVKLNFSEKFGPQIYNLKEVYQLRFLGGMEFKKQNNWARGRENEREK